MQVTAVKVTYRASAEIRKIWYTFEFGIEVQVGPDDDLDEVKRKAWNTCMVEVEKQVSQVTEQ